MERLSRGTVVDVSRDEVMIDIGFKSEGYIPAEEFDSDENDLPSVKVGDEIDVYIVRREDSEGQINLSKKIADQTLVWDEITEAFESGSPVEGQITERIKGGLRVTVGYFTRIFCLLPKLNYVLYKILINTSAKLFR